MGIDFAIKCFWNLHAIQFYSKVSSQWERCDELRQNLEMIVVNGQLPRSLLQQIPSDIQQKLSKAQTYPIIEEDGEEKKQQQNNHSNNHNNNNDNSSQKPLQNGHTLPPPPQQQSNGNSNHINSTLPQPKKPNNIL